MNRFEITTEVTADFSKSLAQEFDIKVLPMKYTMNDQEFEHTIDYTMEDITQFYDELEAGARVSTSQITPTVYMSIFEEILREGKDILHIGFSSALSGSFQSAALAFEMLKADYPDRTCILVDSLGASGGHALLSIRASELRAQNEAIETVADYLNAHVQLISHRFFVDSLDHLKNGGRISSTTAVVGNILSIYPILTITGEGKVEAFDKIRGEKKAVGKLKSFFDGNNDQSLSKHVVISHADNLDKAKLLEKELTENYNDLMIHITEIGPILGVHVGKGTIAICYFATGR